MQDRSLVGILLSLSLSLLGAHRSFLFRSSSSSRSLASTLCSPQGKRGRVRGGREEQKGGGFFFLVPSRGGT